MFGLIILIFLTLILYLWLVSVLKKAFIQAGTDYDNIGKELDNLKERNIKLKLEQSALEKTVWQTIMLYDVARDTCKSLEEDAIFGDFYSDIRKLIEVRDCKFVKDKKDLTLYSDYKVLTLDIDKGHARYLAFKGVKEQDADKLDVLAQQFLLGIKRAFLYQKVEELAIMDSLTQVLSRRYLMERFSEEIERSQKFKFNFSFLMIDIDHFKDYNDRYGHLVGDVILSELAKTLKDGIRQIDLIGRYGGEEFCVILIETDKEGAEKVAQRLRQAVAGKQFKAYDENLKVTVSIGMAMFPQDSTEMQLLVDKADAALYRAKQSGRNCVCVFNQ